MSSLENYLREMRTTHGTGAAVTETSYYPPLSNLLNSAGRPLAPRVSAIIHVRNEGAGIPDGGLFTSDQFPDEDAPGDPLGQDLLPSRGVIEAKGLAAQVERIAGSPQVRDYLGLYGQVLVTNYRDFLLVVRGRDGGPVEKIRFTLAASEQEFWQKASRPEETDAEVGEDFIAFLRTAMQYSAPLLAPREVARHLAFYARLALRRVEQSEAPTLNGIREALSEALGISFTGERGEHFFRSTLVQTLFYGVFSAWVLWSRQGPAEGERFQWRLSAWQLQVPVIRALFERLANRTQLDQLNLVQILDWTGDALGRVDHDAFFRLFDEEDAVQYFYEPFLDRFDPELRRELGVWYTPREVVRYMVERVDRALVDDLGIADGLADKRVVVLDPCTGTGAFLHETLKVIARRLEESGAADALGGNDLKKIALTRLFGFEILPAPYVIAHLQLGLLLSKRGVPLTEGRGERLGVYLTNALTGWAPPTEEGQRRVVQLAASYPELGEERDAAEGVKRDEAILVVIGNPPYNGFAGVAVGEERDLSDAYRTTVRAPAPEGQGLNELSVRFFRMAERKIVERTGQGIVCFISNYAWLRGSSFPGMRERFTDVFDRIDIDCLNGDRYKTGKTTPDGQPDPSVFSTPMNREGIQVGTAISLMVRKPHEGDEGDAAGGEAGDAGEAAVARGRVRFRHFWGVDKRADLLRSLEASPEVDAETYTVLAPPLALGLPFFPVTHGGDYLSWPKLTDLFPAFYPGVQTKRDEVVVDIDRDRLLARMNRYFDAAVSDEEMARISPASMASTARFDAPASRRHLVNRGFLPQYVVPYCHRPFDQRWIYWEPETRLLGERSPAYFPQVFPGNLFFSTAQNSRREFSPPGIHPRLSSLHVVEWSASMFPLKTRAAQGDLFAVDAGDPLVLPDGSRWNISQALLDHLRGIGGDAGDAEHAFYHAVAVMHSPSYAAENKGALQQDWPRIPLPTTREALLASSELGRKVAALLDPDTPVPGVTSGAIRPEIRQVAPVLRVGGGGLNPDGGDLAVTARWGYAGNRGVTMPGPGRMERRDYSPAEAAVLSADMQTVLGAQTYDVHLNDVAYWQNIPTHVWDFTLGGYKVIKKWLSYRERALLGRDLKAEEVREVTAMARRITALLLLRPALDANYLATAPVPDGEPEPALELSGDPSAP